MDAGNYYRKWLKLLKSKLEPEAAHALLTALLKGTSIGSPAFSRADKHRYREYVHHCYGCPDGGAEISKIAHKEDIRLMAS